MVKLNEPFTAQHGILHIGAVSAISLAKQFGTPLYAYSAGRIRDNYQRLLQAFQKKRNNFRLFYAIKANNNTGTVRMTPITIAATFTAKKATDIASAISMEMPTFLRNNSQPRRSACMPDVCSITMLLTVYFLII